MKEENRMILPPDLLAWLRTGRLGQAGCAVRTAERPTFVAGRIAAGVRYGSRAAGGLFRAVA